MKQGETADKKLISIICPAYNEEKNIPVFYDRFKRVTDSLAKKYTFELIFTNNRSTDGTLDAMMAIYREDPRIQILTMSRNFGYQGAVLGGMKHATGDAVIVIDADCEDPPELLPKFLEKWEEGYDIVYGIRGDRPMGRVEKESRDLFYRLLKKTADMDIILYMAEFALISRHVKDIATSTKNTFPFIRAEIGYAGFNRFGIEFDRQARSSGKSNYNIFGMFSFAIAGILTSSTFLFRFAFYALPLIILINAALFFVDAAGIGEWAFKLLVALDLIFLIILITVNGLYFARIYKNQIGRPPFIVDPRLSRNNPFPDETYIPPDGLNSSK